MSVPCEHVGVTLALPLTNIIHVISKPPSHSLALCTKNGGWLVLVYPNIVYSYQLDQMFPRVIMHIPMLKDTTNMRAEFMTSYCMMSDDL